MIEYIKGELTEITPAMAVIECNGLGYGINVSLNTYSAIQGKKEVKLYIYESIREDAYILYGFAICRIKLGEDKENRRFTSSLLLKEKCTNRSKRKPLISKLPHNPP